MLSARAVLALGRLLLAPEAPGFRLFPISSETAHYLFLWLRRLAGIIIYGYFVIETVALFGAPLAVYDGLSKLLGLVVTILLVIVILQNRPTVAAIIRGETGSRGVHVLRARIAEIWHVLAIAYLAGAFIVYGLDIPGVRIACAPRW